MGARYASLVRPSLLEDRPFPAHGGMLAAFIFGGSDKPSNPMIANSARLVPPRLELFPRRGRAAKSGDPHTERFAWAPKNSHIGDFTPWGEPMGDCDAAHPTHRSHVRGGGIRPRTDGKKDKRPARPHRSRRKSRRHRPDSTPCDYPVSVYICLISLSCRFFWLIFIVFGTALGFS